MWVPLLGMVTYYTKYSLINVQGSDSIVHLAKSRPSERASELVRRPTASRHQVPNVSDQGEHGGAWKKVGDARSPRYWFPENRQVQPTSRIHPRANATGS